ncbi:hypothetical protein [Tsuneonella sp. SYSU-LHT278]|uniref:hypothetical protein n=1 Tax=Tsuneonella sediminis TaxID=3416089 RepID=UPI003F78D265
MKTLLYVSAAASALVGTTVHAQTHQTTNINEYASSAPINGSATSINATNAGEVAAAEAILAQGNNPTVALGTRYTARTTAADDTTAATPTVENSFTLTGTVSKDCSFYAGNTTGARTIDFGTIGIRTGNNENVNAAFEMAGPASADVQTLTAGCNTNNSVEISKNDIRGMVNANPGGYDTDEFQANIPYSVQASWTGVGVNSIASGTPQTFTVPTTANAGSVQQGAWRSTMDIKFNAPAITDRGLVAGTYTGTTTVTLRAL